MITTVKNHVLLIKTGVPMHLFYHPDISSSLVTVSPDESRHISVLRLKPGEHIHLTDGKGLLCKALISDSNSKAIQLQILEQYENYNQPGYYLHIAIAPTKQMDRLEWFLEKATEIGVSEISLIISAHSERKEVKTERLQKILQSAIKQSLKAFLPVLNTPVSFADFIKQKATGKKFLASAMAGTTNHLKDKLVKSESAVVLIGPEGDFAPDELIDAENKDYKMISLGAHRLRTETAGLIVCAEVAMLNN